MSNSSLVVYKKISPNKTKRTHKIDTVTVHVMAGDLSIERCGDVFASPLRLASSNYGIDSKGRCGLYVPEDFRSWCSSNRQNDDRAITIEVANDGGAETGYHVSDKAYKALIDLLADVCKRNDIKELKWKADKSLIGQIDKQNMTVHRWFKNKACPGDYLYSHMGDIAKKVNAKLSANKSTKKSSDASSDKSSDVKSDSCNASKIKCGDTVKIKKGAKSYNGTKLSSFVYLRKYTVSQIVADRAVVTWKGTVVAAVNVKNLIKV